MDKNSFFSFIRKYLRYQFNRLLCTILSDKPKPFLMYVRFMGFSYRCGYGIRHNDEEFALRFRVLESEKAKQYGEYIEVYSRSLSRYLRPNEVICLRFIENADYDPNLTDSQPVKLFVDP